MTRMSVAEHLGQALDSEANGLAVITTPWHLECLGIWWRLGGSMDRFTVVVAPDQRGELLITKDDVIQRMGNVRVVQAIGDEGAPQAQGLLALGHLLRLRRRLRRGHPFRLVATHNGPSWLWLKVPMPSAVRKVGVTLLDEGVFSYLPQSLQRKVNQSMQTDWGGSTAPFKDAVVHRIMAGLVDERFRLFRRGGRTLSPNKPAWAAMNAALATKASQEETPVHLVLGQPLAEFGLPDALQFQWLAAAVDDLKSQGEHVRVRLHPRQQRPDLDLPFDDDARSFEDQLVNRPLTGVTGTMSTALVTAAMLQPKLPVLSQGIALTRHAAGTVAADYAKAMDATFGRWIVQQELPEGFNPKVQP